MLVALILAFGFTGAMLLVLKPSLLVPVCVVITFASTPSFLPQQYTVSGIAVFTYEPFLVAASIFMWTRYRGDRKTAWRLGVLAGVVLLGFAHGLLTGVPQKAFGEARNLFTLIGYAFLASHTVGTYLANGAWRAIRWTLWWSAGLTTVAAGTGLALAGRTDIVGFQFASGTTVTTDATRYISPATYLAVVVACGCVAILAAGRSTIRAVVPTLAPCLVLLGLAFSRNNLLALAVAALFGFIAKFSGGRAARTVFALWQPRR